MKLRLANGADDTRLRALARDTIVPGHIRMIYAREPGYFAAAEAAGGTTQIIVADDNGRVVGEACRSIRDLYVNGRPTRMGYLSGLRIRHDARNGTVLARGYAYLKKLHREDVVPAYLTTIIDGNTHARELLTSGRAGLPTYTPMGRYLTMVIPVRTRPPRARSPAGFEIVNRHAVAADDLNAFIQREGPRRQFFPVCSAEPHERTLPDLIGRENISVAVRDSRILGVLALWDQHATRQCIVSGYSPAFTLLRPALNAYLRARRCAPLPPAGAPLRYAVAGLASIRDDDPTVFNCLLQAVRDHATRAGIHQLAVGMHARDPLCPYTKTHARVTYRSSLYLVAWDRNPDIFNNLDPDRVPYLELGTL